MSEYAIHSLEVRRDDTLYENLRSILNMMVNKSAWE
jgi:hypothetical protein